MARHPQAVTSGARRDLTADCGDCFGLCCVLLPFSASADFAIDKDAGRPCPHLAADFGCGIHSRLRRDGFAGCAVFDCFGAGQKVCKITFAGRDWRRDPAITQRMSTVFPVMRQLHELLWYLTEALTLPSARPVHAELRHALRTSELVRAKITGRKKNHRGADLIGADLARADLRGADLRAADLIGADLRDADLRGADLTGGLFLTRPQLDAAKGDATTRLPPAFARPAHW